MAVHQGMENCVGLLCSLFLPNRNYGLKTRTLYKKGDKQLQAIKLDLKNLINNTTD